MANLRDAGDTLAAAVATTIDQLALDKVDAGAVALAKHYATAIDSAHCTDCGADTSLDTLGPKLLACLESLGATPAARSKLRKGGQPSDGPSGLARLREARAG